VMEFKKFSAGKHTYGNANPDNRPHMRKAMGLSEKEDISNVNFDDPDFYSHWASRDQDNYECIEKVLLNLAICHNIIIESKNGVDIYNASSPDELALVKAARFFGIKFVERDEENNIFIDYKGERQKWRVLNSIEFNSTRKRMTVVVRDP
jgi:phospholipid-transporting ATPase